MSRNVCDTCEKSLILKGQRTQHEHTCNHMNKIDCKITGMYTIITTMITHKNVNIHNNKVLSKAQNINKICHNSCLVQLLRTQHSTKSVVTAV